jgi:formimidoylglutamate deiminase
VSVNQNYRFDGLLQREGWLSPGYVGVNEKGLIRYLSAEPPTERGAFEAVSGYAIPGFQNAHSHAFQYAMAGLAENFPSDREDDFWTWREQMYKCALSVNPDEACSIAAMLYSEMLRHGYTHVAEFHYLHHDKDGKPYQHLAEIGERMLQAAKTAGIKLTLIPVFYQKGGFGLEPQPRQKRFISHTVDDYFRLLEATEFAVKKYSDARMGFSVHSLRAVDLPDVIKTYERGPKELPFHIHVAEQKKEVTDCRAYCGLRPMQWLLKNLPVNEKFHLIHSTHLDNEELKGLVASEARVVLCPSTEGNLGDGIFRMKEFYDAGGHWSIGTDSHIGINPLEEFRMMDYRQRLITHRRNIFKGDASQYMVNEEIKSGREAMGLNYDNHFAVGQPFDAVVLDAKSPLVASTSQENLLSTLVYTGDSSCNLGTIVNGKWIVKSQQHNEQEHIRLAFDSAMKNLKSR